MDWESIEAQWCNRHEPEQLQLLTQLLSRLRDEQADAPEFGLLWRRSRLFYFMALQAIERNDATEAELALNQAMNEAQLAVKLDDTQVESVFWFGVTQIDNARRKGMLATARVLPGAERHIDRAIKIDEEYYFAGPLRVWGRMIHFKPLLLGGSVDRALDIYRRALQIDDSNSTTLLYYAEALIADKQFRTAREVLRRIIDGSPLPCWRWEQERDRAAARKLLEAYAAAS